MATHSTFYVGHLKRYHDPVGPPSQTEGGQVETTPPRNEAESSGQLELPLSKPVTDTRAGTQEIHTKGMTVQSGKNSGKNYTQRLSPDGVPSCNTAVNPPVKLSSFTNQRVHILTKDL
ncbi:Hypothetical protein PHPALM_1228 [Phytophthora palmivora]|uniref:Pol protein n=1 Tax=Phytophthora palmivora TaxID=4796 RepID=A0A2P4YSX7_9STRA|nr:Hypothetical protein PHPALM_1228 [Phytophthora palmivora]